MADSEEERLVSISGQLNTLVSEGRTDDTVPILCDLRDQDISLRLLKKTQIGRAVNNVRRNSNNAEVIALAKKIVNKWRRSAESQYNSVVSATGELPNSQMSQMTEETQMSQSQQTTGCPIPMEHHQIKTERREEKETGLTQDFESLLPPSNRSALLLHPKDKGTGLVSTQNKDAEQEHDRETSQERQDNLLLQQTQQSNNSECPKPESYTRNKTSLTTGLVEGIRATSPRDGVMSGEPGSDHNVSQLTHLSEGHQSQQATVHAEKNSARAEEGHPRANTSTNNCVTTQNTSERSTNTVTTQNTCERPMTEIQSLRRDVSQIQRQVARIESVLTMLFTPLKQNLDRVSSKLSALEQRQTARNSQNAVASSHDALEAEALAYPDWQGTTSLSTGPSFRSNSASGSNTMTHRPQSSSKQSLLPLKVKSEPVDHGYDLATANDELPITQETGGSPSQLLLPQMTEDGCGIRFESLSSDTEKNKTAACPNPGPSTEPDISPRKKLKLDHPKYCSLPSWMAGGSVGKSSGFQDRCSYCTSDVEGLKVVRGETDSEDDSDQEEGEPVLQQSPPAVLETPDNPSASNAEANFGEKETFDAQEESQPPQRVALESDFRPERVKWLRQRIKFSTVDHLISCSELKSLLRQHFGYTSDQELGHAVKDAFPDVTRKRRRVKGRLMFFYAGLQWVGSETLSDN
ncbi:PREDICTED: uncharacterized protein LOC109474344 [Branchiostoma belcheri]|uniref:Uncharacterized protein LOC109474344 n=1 Tax=Branchiostoma belcheri TaxID=7741 RepID=A0A6P4ZGK1_BRABE|nr:PREDICTED: uncharacterized protein LOC109474344 [Branchiostoma belcheri]XP_019630197.1 PREDICTED: uncharacterized protein LOC109474344 [Branchiostoma belcheri]